MHSWPWGRTHPKTRMKELEQRKRHFEAQKKIVQQKAQETLRNIEKNIDAINKEKSTVSEFLEEARRRDLFRKAYQLEAEGFDVIDKIKGLENNTEIENAIQNAHHSKMEAYQPGSESDDDEHDEIDTVFFQEDTDIDEITQGFLKTGEDK